MAIVVQLTFNPFQENTFIVYDETGDCVLFDPGCSNRSEEEVLERKIESLGLRPVRLINTHCHIDHILGNGFVARRYGLSLEIHRQEKQLLDAGPEQALFFGMPFSGEQPPLGSFLEEGDRIIFGKTELRALFTPGHSPGSLSFFCEESQFVIAGDVLFYGSIGRTDLPGGDYDTLITSIQEKLLPLGDKVRVYCGHGPYTTIGFERDHNPFLKGEF